MVCRFTLAFFEAGIIDMKCELESIDPNLIMLFIIIFEYLNSIYLINTLLLKFDF